LDVSKLRERYELIMKDRDAATADITRINRERQ